MIREIAKINVHFPHIFSQKHKNVRRVITETRADRAEDNPKISVEVGFTRIVLRVRAIRMHCSEDPEAKGVRDVEAKPDGSVEIDSQGQDVARGGKACQAGFDLLELRPVGRA